MTVGITFTNGLEAAVITDSRVSGGRRQSDSDDKLSFFIGDNYHFVLFATGSASSIDSVAKRLPAFKTETLDGHVVNMQCAYSENFLSLGERWLMHEKRKIEIAARMIEDEKLREAYIKNKTEETLRMAEQNSDRYASDFVVVGHDKKQDRIRTFSFSPRFRDELFLPHIEIGSGADGAGLYLSTKLQGIDATKLSPEQLVFFVLNAYATSTVNQGVGGIPRIALVSKEKVTVYDPERTTAMTNLAGAYLAEFNPALRPQLVVDRLGELIHNQRPDYRSLAKELGLSVDAVKTLYVPYGSWQGRSNSRSFRKK